MTTTTETRRDHVAELAALIPDHAHRHNPILGGVTWTWTTPAGSWCLTIGTMFAATAQTPYGRLGFPGKLGDHYDQIVGVLRALGGVSGDGPS